MPGTFPIGRVAGIPLLVHWSTAIVALLVGINLAPVAGLSAAGFAVVGFLASIVAHELAHALVARRFDVHTTSIELWALGGVARLDRDAPSPKAEALIAGAGPMASLIVGGAFFAAAATVRLDAWPELDGVLGWLAVVNVVLTVFNLLPGAPLDGGRIVRAALWARHGDRFRAAEQAATGGRVIGWTLAGFGIWLGFTGRPALFVVLTGVFLAVNAKAEAAASRAAGAIAGVSVGELTRYGIARADGDTDAETMLWERSRLGLPGVVAIERGGRIEGLVAEEQLWDVPAAARSTMRLSQLMVPMTRLAQAHPDEDVADVLSRLNPLSPLVTVWRDEQLLGVVPAAVIRDRLRRGLGAGSGA